VDSGARNGGHSCSTAEDPVWSASTTSVTWLQGIIAIPKHLSFEPEYVLQEGLTSPLELVLVIFHGHKNKPLHLESVMSVVPWITW